MNDYIINDMYGYNDTLYLDSLITRVFNTLNISNASCSILFVDDATIKKINLENRGIDRVTDVISFALEDGEEPFLSYRVLGDIYISIPKMKEQAKEYGHSEKRELSFLVVHGLLHLLGYDHMEKEEEEIMFSLQEKILEEEGILQ